MVASQSYTGEGLVGESPEVVEDPQHLGLGVGEGAHSGVEDLDVKRSDQTRTPPGLQLVLGGGVVRHVVVEDSHPVTRHGRVGVAEGRHILGLLLEL